MAQDEKLPAGVSRREFASVAAAAAAGWLLTACGARRLHEMPPEKLRKAVQDLEREYGEKYGKSVTVSDSGPMPGVVFAYALDISRCIGCRRCVYACVEENNQSRDPQVQWIRVLAMDKEKGIDLAHADPYYEPKEVPEDGHFYVPTQCQQCRNAPCTKVCPTGATWMEPDGIVVIDYDWCIGCRYCMAACPYGARHFNWGEPSLPTRSTRTCTCSATGRARRGSWKSARSASSGRARAATRPASRRAPWGRASSATCSIRRARSATSSSTSACCCSSPS
jgi:molybdopterin-containing oxidoreductase family iron-sulfur binding subunit